MEVTLTTHLHVVRRILAKSELPRIFSWYGALFHYVIKQVEYIGEKASIFLFQNRVGWNNGKDLDASSEDTWFISQSG
jgi:hypothetical protein